MVSQLRPRDQAGAGRALHRVHHSLLTGDFALEIFKNGIICLPNHKKIENQNNYHNFSEAGTKSGVARPERGERLVGKLD